MSYKRPILVEIYASLYLQPRTLTPDRIQTVVLDLKQHGFSSVEQLVAAELSADAADATGSHRNVIRCWSPDHTRLVQLAPDHVAMNLVTPDGTYPGWDAFLTTVVEPATRSMTALIPNWQPYSIALNTVDRAIISAASGFRLGDYLNCGGPRVPAILANTSGAFDYDVGRGLLDTEGHNRQLHISGQISEESYVLQTVSVFHNRIELTTDVLPTLAILHEESNSWFESLITDRLRSEVMGGVVHAISGT